jgi:hypothetical protein
VLEHEVERRFTDSRYDNELLLRRIKDYLVRWAKRKYKRLHDNDRRARQWLVRVARCEPRPFAHWRLGAARWLDHGSGVSGDVQAPTLREPRGATRERDKVWGSAGINHRGVAKEGVVR